MAMPARNIHPQTFCAPGCPFLAPLGHREGANALTAWTSQGSDPDKFAGKLIQRCLSMSYAIGKTPHAGLFDVSRMLNFAGNKIPSQHPVPCMRLTGPRLSLYNDPNNSLAAVKRIVTSPLGRKRRRNAFAAAVGCTEYAKRGPLRRPCATSRRSQALLPLAHTAVDFPVFTARGSALG
jgi:hypothetical protein